MSRKESDYWASRKTLRLRPVDMGNDKESTIKFMTEKLMLDETTVRCLGDFRVERVPFGPKTRHKNEMMVVFQSVEARDVVRSAATNLAGSGPDVGIRLEVPNHLRAAMKALQLLSYDLKGKYPNIRRNILYDDETLDLVLDFCTTPEGKWRRISSDQARHRKRNGTGAVSGAFRLEEGELDSILGDAPDLEDA